MFVLAVGAMHMRRGVGGVFMARMRMAVPVIVVVPMCVTGMPTVAAVIAIGPAFRLEGLRHLHHRHVHGAQHVGQHMVGFDFQVVGFELDRHMAVAKVVCSARQVEW